MYIVIYLISSEILPHNICQYMSIICQSGDEYLQYGLYERDGFACAWGAKEHVGSGATLSTENMFDCLLLSRVKITVKELAWVWDGLSRCTQIWKKKKRKKKKSDTSKTITLIL